MLRGAVKLRTILDKNSIKAIARQIDAAIQKEGAATLVSLAITAQRSLYHLDVAADHPFLARLWDHGKVKKTAFGMMIEVYSRAETLTFYSKAGPNRQPDKRYPVPGKALLAMLEGGVKAHPITPRQAGGSLAFPVKEGVKTSDYAGTAITSRGVQAARFLGPKPDSELFLKRVKHPGFAGNHHIAATRILMERRISASGEAMARRIALRLSAGV